MAKKKTSKKTPARRRRAVAPPKKFRKTIPRKKKNETYTAYHDRLSGLAAEALKAGDKAASKRFQEAAARVVEKHPRVRGTKRPSGRGKPRRKGPGTYPWKQCMADQRRRYPKLSQERRAAICGAIRSRSRQRYPAYWKAQGNPAPRVPLATNWPFDPGEGDVIPHFRLERTDGGQYHWMPTEGQLQFLGPDGRFTVIDREIDAFDAALAVDEHMQTGKVPGKLRQGLRSATGRTRYGGARKPSRGRATLKASKVEKNPSASTHKRYGAAALSEARATLKSAQAATRDGLNDVAIGHALDAVSSATRAYWNAVDAEDHAMQDAAMKVAARARNVVERAAGVPTTSYTTTTPIRNPAKKTHLQAGKRALTAARSHLKAAEAYPGGALKVREGLNAFAEATRSYWECRYAGDDACAERALGVASSARNIVRGACGYAPRDFSRTALKSRAKKRTASKKKAPTRTRAKKKGGVLRRITSL